LILKIKKKLIFRGGCSVFPLWQFQAVRLCSLLALQLRSTFGICGNGTVAHQLLDVRRNNENSEQMFCKIFAVVCCDAEMSARSRKINIYFAPSRLGKKVFIYFYLMDVSRRCVRISAAEINIMQILERRIVCGLYCKCRFRNVCRVYRERRYVGYRAYVALRYAT